MVLLAKNARGWRNLMLLTSQAYSDGFYRYPCIDEELLDKWSDGLLASTTCISGYIPQAILRGDDAAASSSTPPNSTSGSATTGTWRSSRTTSTSRSWPTRR
jgi:DNA polymerase III alpha subunit